MRSAFLASHCLAPAGLVVSSHSFSNRFLKKRLLHCVGVCVQVTSRPPVMASAPCPCRACSSSRGPDPRVRRLPGRGRSATDRRRHGSCRRSGRRRSARRFPRRSSPCGRRSRGCPWPPRRVRIAVRTFRIDVDQAHLDGAERLRKLAFAAVAFVAQPRALGTPVELLRAPRRRRGRRRNRRS